MKARKTKRALSWLVAMAAVGFSGTSAAWGISNILVPVLKEGGRMVTGALGPGKEERDRRITETLKQQYDPEKNREAFEAMLAQSGLSEEEKADARKRYEARMKAAQDGVGQSVAAQRAHSEALAGSPVDRIVRGALGQGAAIDTATAATRLPGQAASMDVVTGAAETAARTGMIQSATKEVVKDAEEKAQSGNAGAASAEAKPAAETVPALTATSKDPALVRRGNEIDVRPGASNAESFAAVMRMFGGLGRANREAATVAPEKPSAAQESTPTERRASETAK